MMTKIIRRRSFLTKLGLIVAGEMFAIVAIAIALAWAASNGVWPW